MVHLIAQKTRTIAVRRISVQGKYFMFWITSATTIDDH